MAEIDAAISAVIRDRGHLGCGAWTLAPDGLVCKCGSIVALERPEIPPVGGEVSLRWRGTRIPATVVRHRGGGLADLSSEGIEPSRLVAVGHGLSGWLLPEEVPSCPT